MKPKYQSLRQERLNHINRSVKGGAVLVGALCAAGGANAQEAEAEAAEAADAGTLPAQVVEAAPEPAPRPAPRPKPAPRPAPAPVVVEAPEPVIQSDTLLRSDRLSSPKFTQPLLDTPQSVQVISSELMQQQGATSLRDALRNVSGITMQAGEGGAPPGDNLSIRGFSARSDFYVDGIRDLGAYSRDPFNLEQVEVVKGPSSASSGRGSTGGSINLVSKMAKLDDFANTDLSVGTDDLYRGTIDINSRIKGIEGSALRVNVMGHENGVPGRDAARNSRWGIAGSLAFGLGENVTSEPSPKSSYFDKNGYGGKAPVTSYIPNDTRLYLNFFHMEEDNLPDFGVPWISDTATDPRLVPYINSSHPDVFDNFYGSRTRDLEEISSTMFTVRFEHDFSDSFGVRNQTRYGVTDRLSLLTSPRFDSTAFPATVRRSDRKDRDEVTSIFANQTDFTAAFDTGSLHHDAVLGFEFIHEEYDRYGRDSDPGIITDYFNPTPGDAISSRFVRNGDETHGSADTLAAYAFDTVEVNDWLELTGGIRYERFETDTIGTGSPYRSRVDEMVSGRAGIVVKPAENGSVYFSWGTSFNPSGEFLTLTEDGRSPGNFDVDPEKNETFELGTKWDLLENRLSLTAAIFQTEKTNARDIDPADPTVYTLTGEQQVQGFELGLSGAITDWWSIYASYTHLDGEVTKAFDPTLVGSRLNNTPEDTFSLWSQVELENGLFFGAGPVFIGDRINSVGSERIAPAYWTWDASIGYHVNENLTLQVNGRNLSDESYIDRMSGGHFIPGDARSVMFTASMKF
ncbi:TonB-dependent siderophore receptor [Verrucomicrobiales bacterium BCK34]|nr:TonB-dependent siderophore receptor [Verrucomicrobiales bacterium BCK34]